jgi:prephenate dehydratase
MLKLVVGLAALGLVCGSIPVLAQGQGENLVQRKQMHLNRIATHIQILQQEQACIQAAANGPAIRACEQTREAAVQAMMQQFRGLN